MEFLLADDHVYTRRGIQQIIEAQYPDVVFSEASNGLEVLNLTRNKKFDVIILDINMPRLNGIETLKQLVQNDVKSPVIVLSIYPEDQYAIRAFKAGASAYLTKLSDSEEFLNALSNVTAGRKYITPTIAEKLALSLNDSHRQLHEHLSDREFLVLKLIASGKQVSGIARELNLSIPTVSTYRARILFKMKMKSNAELTHYAISNGLIEM